VTPVPIQPLQEIIKHTQVALFKLFVVRPSRRAAGQRQPAELSVRAVVIVVVTPGRESDARVRQR
jgi:hypothetical protein